jgi:lactate dehydrogenase-like 2-hydroxyacid dehydrogenase
MVNNIVFLSRLTPQWDKGLEQLGSEFPDINFIKDSETSHRIDLLKNAEAAVCGKLTEEEVKLAANLKIVFVPFTGLNTFPLELLKERGIIISNTHANYNIVAEKAAALALALLGRVVEYDSDLRKGIWNLSLQRENMWTSLQNKTCGILGTGKIGSCIAKFTKAFNCLNIGFKKNINILPEHIDEVSYNLEYVIDKSNIIFITLPLTKDTYHIIDEKVLAKMKNKYLINVGRGDLIVEEALYNALTNGTLAGAGLDVWYNYPGRSNNPVIPSNYPVHNLKNVVLSPHKASHTPEAIQAMIDDTIENIRTYLKTGTPKEIVEKEYYY